MRVTLFWEATTHNHERAHDTLTMVFKQLWRRLTCQGAIPTQTPGIVTPDISQSALPGLPDHLVSVHIFGQLRDPLDIARVLAVSRGMRDAVPVKTRAVLQNTGCKACDAVHCGYLNTAKHLHFKGKLMCLGSRHPCLDCFKENVCLLAANGGQLEVVKWGRTIGCPWYESTCVNAAFGGHLGVIKWAHEHGCPWDDETCEMAARGGHLHVLRWARLNGCPWSERTCWQAAKHGHLEVLKWARVNGCLWDEWVCAKARKGKHVALLRWAKANGAPEWGL